MNDQDETLRLDWEKVFKMREQRPGHPDTIVYVSSYRDMEPIDRPKSGLIVYSVKTKHSCNPPSFFWHSFLPWLPKIEEGSVWRCPDCFQIQVAKMIESMSGASDFLIWSPGSDSDWVEKGGEL